MILKMFLESVILCCMCAAFIRKETSSPSERIFFSAHLNWSRPHEAIFSMSVIATFLIRVYHGAKLDPFTKGRVTHRLVVHTLAEHITRPLRPFAADRLF